jgi:hypothetical protein
MSIREDLFNVMKSFGFAMKMYDIDGNGPIIDPEDADYFYCVRGEDSFMIVIEDETSSEYKHVSLYKTESEDKFEFRKQLEKLATIVRRNAYTLTVRSLGKNFTPKDFSTLPKISSNKRAKEPTVESYQIKGFKKTSHFVKENAKVIVHHKEVVDESKQYARSRKIREVLVSTKSGERRKVPNGNLTMGKAIANHINHGGDLFDDTVNRLLVLGSDIDAVKRANLNEGNADEDKVQSLRKTLMDARRQLTKFIGSLSTKKSKIDESVFTDLNGPKHAFSKTYFGNIVGDEKLADSIARISIICSNIKK